MVCPPTFKALVILPAAETSMALVMVLPAVETTMPAGNVPPVVSAFLMSNNCEGYVVSLPSCLVIETVDDEFGATATAKLESVVVSANVIAISLASLVVIVLPLL